MTENAELTTAPAIEHAMDPITLGVVAGGLRAVVKEMSHVIERTGRSPVVAMSHDFSNAVYAHMDGVPEIVAQGQDQPVHLGGMMRSVQSAARLFAGTVAPGDVILGNDPETNGTHLPDVDMIQPVFASDRLVAWVCSRAHHVDTGGPIAGGYNREAVDLFGEGLRIPPIKLVAGGEVREDVWQLILANVRSPELVRGDMAAQLSAVRVATRRVQELCVKYDAGIVTDAMRHLLDRSERLMQHELRAMPDGVYTGSASLENDDIAGAEVTFTCEITVADDEISVVLDSPLALASYRNSYAGLTRGAVYYGVLTALTPGLPVDGGLYRVIGVDVGPRGTMLNAELPTACAMSTSDVWSTVFDAVCDATSQIVPERACAGWCRPSMLQVSGRDPETGMDYSSFLSIAFIGGAGASHRVDGGGLWGMISTAGAATTGDIELLEFRLPLHFHRHELASDSGCPGRWRGAAGAVLEFEPVDHEAIASHDGDGVRLPSVSRLGGGSERDAELRTHAKVVRRPDGTQEEITPNSRKVVGVGERVYCRVAGGGAIGPAHERAIEAVVRDVESDTISLRAAADEYGVVVREDLSVDAKATERRRRELAAAVAQG